MKYINIPVFLISLLLGAFFIYVSAEPTETVLVYPTPENVGKYESNFYKRLAYDEILATFLVHSELRQNIKN